MHDMLVKLYDLPEKAQALKKINDQGVTVRRAAVLEKLQVVEWIAACFEPAWAAEAEITFARQPVSCFLALRGEQILGFACHEATCRNFFGPTGVADIARGLGIGRALLLEALWDQRNQGYAYSIIAGVGPAKFYEDSVGAVSIDGSDPGIFKGLLTM